MSVSGWGIAHQVCVACLTYSAWLVLLQMGMTLTWNWFSGLLPLAAWWAWWILDPLGDRGRHQRVAMWAAVGVGVGICLAHMGGRTLLGWTGLLLAAWTWAQWLRSVPQYRLACEACGSLSRLCVSVPTQLAGLLLAVWLAADPMLWTHRWPGLLMVWLAWLLCACMSRRVLQPSHGVPSFLFHPAMALMMGGQLLMAQWCVAIGWTYTQAVLAHGIVMVLAHAVHQVMGADAGAAPSPWAPNRWHRSGYALAPLLGIAAAVCFWFADDAAAMLAAMALIALSHSQAPAFAEARAYRLWTLSLFLPALLWMGYAAPTGGPPAIAGPLIGLSVVWAIGVWVRLWYARRAS